MTKDLVIHEDVVEELERTKWSRQGKQFLKDWRLYLLLVPLLVFLFLFRYKAMWGVLLAFQSQDAGAATYSWRGIEGFMLLFSPDWISEFWAAFRNTFVLSMYGLCFAFPMPILLALFFSEIKNAAYRNITQIITYLPKFLSSVVVSTIIIYMLSAGSAVLGPGVLHKVLESLGVTTTYGKGILYDPTYFRAIFQISGIWEGTGYGSIVYFAAIMSISPTSYEAAKIDGANKIQQIRYVTLPGIASTLTIMLILRIGEILNVGYEKVILLQNGSQESYATSNILSAWIYNLKTTQTPPADNMLVSADLFNSIIAMILVLGSNFISRQVSDTSLF